MRRIMCFASIQSPLTMRIAHSSLPVSVRFVQCVNPQNLLAKLMQRHAKPGCGFALRLASQNDCLSNPAAVQRPVATVAHDVSKQRRSQTFGDAMQSSPHCRRPGPRGPGQFSHPNATIVHAVHQRLIARIQIRSTQQQLFHGIATIPQYAKTTIVPISPLDRKLM